MAPAPGSDLDAILSKACAEDASQRYEDAGALRGDLARMLANRPVNARGRAPLYVAQRFLRRTWLASLLATAVLLSSVVALVVIVQTQTRASMEAERANEVASLLTAAFEETDPFRGGDSAVMGAVAERVERSLEDQPLRPNAQWEVQMLLGSAYATAGDYERAFERQGKALDLARDAYGDDDPRVAEVLRRLGIVESARGRYGEADRRFVEALAILSETPDREVEQNVLDAQGQFLQNVGRAEEAKRVLRRAYRLCRQRLGQEPRCYKPLQGVASVLVQQNDSLQSAETIYRESYTAYREAYGERDLRTAVALSNRANALSHLGDLAQGIQLQRNAVEVIGGTLDEDHPTRMAAIGLLATMLAQRGVTDPESMVEARDLIEEQVAYHRQQGTGTVSLATALNNLGAATSSRGEDGDWAGAITYYEEALQVLSRIGVSDDHALVANSHNNLAVALMRSGEYDRAEPHFQRSIELRRQRVGPDHPDIGFFLMTYAQQLSYRDDRAGAEETIDRAIRVLSDGLGSDHPEVGMAMMVKGTLLIRWGRREEGMTVGREEARIRTAATGQ